MIELLMKPKKAERRPWEMFFVGLFWASVSLLLVTIVFAKDFSWNNDLKCDNHFSVFTIIIIPSVSLSSL